MCNKITNPQEGAEKMCIELGYDAFEISAHRFSAPDHEPVQGHLLLVREYYKMQNGEDFVDVTGVEYKGFSRKICSPDCGHIASPFSTKHSVRVYDDHLLESYIAENHIGCTIDGDHYTIYEVMQLMREVEREVCAIKRKAVSARANEDWSVCAACQEQIDALDAYYTEIAARAGLSTHRERMVVMGFKMYKK